MVIAVLWGMLGLFYWGCFIVRQVVLATRSPVGTRLKRSALYWLDICGAVAASFIHTLTFIFFGAPVLVVACLPLAVLPDAYTEGLRALTSFMQ